MVSLGNHIMDRSKNSGKSRQIYHLAQSKQLTQKSEISGMEAGSEPESRSNDNLEVVFTQSNVTMQG